MVRPRHVPERSCFSCGRRAGKRELVRLVRTVGGSVEVDPIGKVSGRGAYLCLDPECWNEGLKKTRLDRVLKCSVSPETRERLLAYAQDRLGPERTEGETLEPPSVGAVE